MQVQTACAALLQKMESDSTAHANLAFLLHGTNARGAVILFRDCLVERHRELTSQAPAPWRKIDVRPYNLVKCYHRGLELFAPELPRAMIREFHRLLVAELDEARITHYRTVFLRAGGLHLLDPESRDVVVRHVLARLEQGLSYDEIRAAQGLGTHLSPDDSVAFIDAVVQGFRELCAEHPLLIERSVDLVAAEIGDMSLAASRAAVRRVTEYAHSPGLNGSAELRRLAESLSCEVPQTGAPESDELVGF